MVMPYNTLEAKPIAATQIIPLSRAILCLDCNCITEATNEHCLACGSKSVLSLSSILDRQADGEK
jgi:hypothetical protein